MPDYSRYRFGLKEKILYYGQGIAIVSFCAYFFFRSAISGVLLLWLFPLVIKRRRWELCEKRKHMLCLQFKEAILSMSTNMQAGYSVENSVKSSLGDMQELYGGKSDMVRELQVLVKSIDNNVPLELSFQEFGKRSGVKHIQNFADIFVICKRSGGDMTEIMMNTASIIGEGIDVEREIETIISSRKLETKVMNLIPFAIVAYISISSPGFFDSLYHNLAGNIVMSICLLLYFLSLSIESRIMRIEV